MTVAAVILLAILLDVWLGEPKKGHPLVAFGRAADWLELRLNGDGLTPGRNRFRGLLAVSLLLVAGGCAALLLGELPTIGIALQVLLLYLCLGGARLTERARRVGRPLALGQVAPARRRVGALVSRDTERLDEHGVAGAAVESVLKNGNDAIFGTLFWFVVAGPAGAVVHRLAHTLATMWNVRSPRHRDFGMAAARLAAVLSFIPARLTALSYALVGNRRGALGCWRQAGHWDSPNSGPLLASGAGALGLELGGPASYGGELRERPRLGCSRAPRGFDIERALALVQRAIWLWVAVIAAGGWWFA